MGRPAARPGAPFDEPQTPTKGPPSSNPDHCNIASQGTVRYQRLDIRHSEEQISDVLCSGQEAVPYDGVRERNTVELRGIAA